MIRVFFYLNFNEMLKKGSKRYLKGREDSKQYVKLENEDFAWWRLEDEEVELDRRMQVRMTDEMVLSEKHFVVVPK
jgi:hypothetical protein